MVVINANSSVDVLPSENQEQNGFPSCKHYQIKISRFENEYIIDDDGGNAVGQIKIYPQGDVFDAFIMAMNKETVLAINVRAKAPTIAEFFKPSSSSKYIYAGQLKLEMDGDRKTFTFTQPNNGGNPGTVIHVEGAVSSRKFSVHDGGHQEASFSFSEKDLAIACEESPYPGCELLLLGIAFSASYLLPFKG